MRKLIISFRKFTNAPNEKLLCKTGSLHPLSLSYGHSILEGGQKTKCKALQRKAFPYKPLVSILQIVLAARNNKKKPAVSFQFLTQQAAGLIKKYHDTNSKITGVLQIKSHPSYFHCDISPLKT
jgi:hypothetical protein